MSQIAIHLHPKKVELAGLAAGGFAFFHLIENPLGQSQSIGRIKDYLAKYSIRHTHLKILLNDPQISSCVVSLSKSQEDIHESIKKNLGFSTLYFSDQRKTVVRQIWEENNKLGFLVFSIPLEKIISYQKSLDKMGFPIESVCTTTQSLYEIRKSCNDLDRQTCAWIFAQEDYAEVLIFQNGLLVYNWIIPEVATQKIDRLIKEIHRALEFYLSRSQSKAIQKIELTVQNKWVPLLKSSLEQYAPETYTPSGFKKDLEPLQKTLLGSFEQQLPLIGLFINSKGSGHEDSLFKVKKAAAKDQLEKDTPLKKWKYWLIGLGMILALIGIRYFYYQNQIQSLQFEYSQIQASVQETKLLLQQIQTKNNAMSFEKKSEKQSQLLNKLLSRFQNLPGLKISRIEISTDYKKIVWDGICNNPLQMQQHIQRLEKEFSKLNILSTQTDTKQTQFKLEGIF